MKLNILLLASIFLFSGCYSISSKTTINKDLTSGYTVSNPIYLSFKNHKSAPYHFLLKHHIAADDYFLHVIWKNSQAGTLFNGLHSRLTFIIDNKDVIDLYPEQLPRVIAFNIESKGYEEEAIFKLNEMQMRKISSSKHVHVELTGKYMMVASAFNSYHTSRAFKEFLDSDLKW